MKPQTQILIIALAIAIAITLALTVALVCLSYANEPVGGEEHTTGRESEATTVYLPVISPPDTDTDTWESESLFPEETDTDAPMYYDNGLRFSSNGDGTCVLLGIGTCTDACVVIPEYAPTGELVTEIKSKAFYGCSSITAIQIPATVEYIGDLAFAACQNLVYISVNTQNSYYCDVEGVLYSADLSLLMAYPSMRSGSTANISSITTEIAEMAFYNCTYLTRICYSGTAEQWDQIRIGAKNYSLTAAAKSFESIGGK